MSTQVKDISPSIRDHLSSSANLLEPLYCEVDIMQVHEVGGLQIDVVGSCEPRYVPGVSPVADHLPKAVVHVVSGLHGEAHALNPECNPARDEK